MKKSLIICFVQMLYIALVFELISYINGEQLFFNISLIVKLLAVATGIAGIVFNVSEFTNPTDNYLKFIKWIKISLIPYFIFNAGVGLAYMLGMLIPFFTLILFLALFIKFVFTYILMMITSSGHIAHIFAMIREKKIDFIKAILFIVFDFIFVFDVVGSIIIHKECASIDKYEEKVE